MREIRQAQSGSGKTLSGPNYIEPEQQQAIAQAASISALVVAIKGATETDLSVNVLVERFEEMCRRHKVLIDAGLRPHIVKLLATELYVNHQALSVPAEKLVSFTLHQGAGGPELKQEFERFRHTPGVFVRAALNYPSDPHGFLRKVGRDIDALAGDPEFERFRDTPGVFATAAIDHPSDPHGFLRKGGRNIDALAGDPEFERFRDTPSVFATAALHNPSDPHGFLRKAKGESRSSWIRQETERQNEASKRYTRL